MLDTGALLLGDTMLIKAYHTCSVKGFKGILNTGSIRPAITKTDGSVEHYQHYTYFRPFQPFLHAPWGNCGFTFDVEVLIREFNGRLCLHTPGILGATQKEVIQQYSDLMDRYEPNDVFWPKPAPLFGDDALDVLRQLQVSIDRYLPHSMVDQSRREHYLMNEVEITCPGKVPISKAYSFYRDIPAHTWWNQYDWDDDIGPKDRVLHQSKWGIIDLEIRLNK